MVATWQSSIEVGDHAMLGHNEGDPLPGYFQGKGGKNKQSPRAPRFPGKMTRDVASRKAHAPRPHFDPEDRHRGPQLGFSRFAEHVTRSDIHMRENKVESEFIAVSFLPGFLGT
jgi:hypothetical protein